MGTRDDVPMYPTLSHVTLCTSPLRESNAVIGFVSPLVIYKLCKHTQIHRYSMPPGTDLNLIVFT
jgi:hypothetical protein